MSFDWTNFVLESYYYTVLTVSHNVLAIFIKDVKKERERNIQLGEKWWLGQGFRFDRGAKDSHVLNYIFGVILVT